VSGRIVVEGGMERGDKFIIHLKHIIHLGVFIHLHLNQYRTSIMKDTLTHVYTPCYKQDTSTLSLCEEVDSALAITSSSYWASCSGMLASTAVQGGGGCAHVHSELVSSFSGVYQAAKGSMHPCTHLVSTQH